MTLRIVAAAMLLACSLAPRVMAAPVGMACQIKGKPELKSGGSVSPLRLLQRLEAGDVVRCGGGEEAIVVLFANGQRFKVGAGANATVQATALTGAQALAGAGGPSARAAQALGGARLGAVMARPAASHQRLTPTADGIVSPAADGSWRLAWTNSGAAEYSFTLLDRFDDVLLNVRTTQAETTLPEAIAARVQLRRPYVWQLASFGKSGKISSPPRWGVVTFLSQADAAELAQSAAPLVDEVKGNPADTTPRALLAELYRSYGAYERTLEELEALAALNSPGATEAQREAYREISPYAFGRWLLLQDDKQAPPDDPARTE